jgi:CheY-like chemotaxis protein
MASSGSPVPPGPPDERPRRARGTTRKVQPATEAATPPPARRILLVDDEAPLLRCIVKMLERRGYHCEGFTVATAALEAAAETPPDAAIIDINMPGMSGIDLCRALEERLGPRTPPRIMLSAVVSEETIRAAFSAGACDYLVKPIYEGVLFAKLERALASAKRPCLESAGGPSVVGPYTLLSHIGRGSSGQVFLASLADDRTHAVKVLWRDLVDDTETLLRFRREVDVLSSLDHPGVIRVHHSGREGDLCYFAMDYLPGGSLATRIARAGALAPAAVLRLLADLAAALAYLHARHIVHRDVKPENVLFTAAGRAVLSDFGLAKRRLDHLTATGDLLGTPIFMAPELLQGQEHEPRSDLYSLGVTALFALAGSSPFPTDIDLFTFVRHLTDGLLPRAQEACPDAPPRLCELIDRIRAPRPEERFASASDLLQEIASCRGAF